MMPQQEPIRDEDLVEAMGTRPDPKFNVWFASHGTAIAQREVTSRKSLVDRRTMMRITSLSAALAACLLLIVGFSGRLTGPAFAQAIERMQTAKSIVWTHDFYLRATSTDGKRNWLHKMSSRRYFQPPGRYRIENLNGKGKVLGIEVRDLESGQALVLNPRTKRAKIIEIDVQLGDTGPLNWILESMRENPLEMLEARKSRDGDVNVFRRVVSGAAGSEDRFLDYWIDPKTKQLVEFRNGIDQPIAPETDPDRNTPGEKQWKGARAIGSIESEFEIDKELSQDLFSIEVPDGYELEVTEQTPTTESDVTKYLSAAIKFSDNRFPDSPFGMCLDQQKFNSIFDKPKSDWTKQERQIADLVKEAQLRGTRFPLMQYVREHCVEDSFRYVGKGITLGESKRIVCWFQLKESKEFRAMYGDLSIKTVQPDELPLSVSSN